MKSERTRTLPKRIIVAIPLALAAIALGSLLAGAAGAAPSGHHHAGPACSALHRSDGKVSLDSVAKRAGKPVTVLLWAEDRCPPSRYGSFWLPRFARYLQMSHGDLRTLMPAGTPYWTWAYCTGSGCGWGTPPAARR